MCSAGPRRQKSGWKGYCDRNRKLYPGEAFLLNAVQRCDLRGKKHLETNAKYHLGDIGLRHGVLGYREADVGGILENLVYLELRRRGYRVAAGSAESGGIDFVATTPTPATC